MKTSCLRVLGDCKSTGTNARRTKNSTFSAFIDIFVRFVNCYDHERPKSDIGRLRCRIFVVFLKGLRKEHPMFNLKPKKMLSNKKKVSYIVIQRKNPMNKEEEPKYYMKAHATEYIGVPEISRRIEKECTVTRADVTAVLTALEDVFVDALSAGQVIRLGDLGTFYLSVLSKGAENEKDLNGSFVKRAKINFRPGTLIKGCLKTLSYSKYSEPAKIDDEEPDIPIIPDNGGN